MLALTGMVAPSLILLLSADHLNPTEQAHLLLANLPAVLQDLDIGCVVSISRNHLRVKSLPIRRALSIPDSGKPSVVDES
jgi:hypothetical protein